MTDRCPSCGTWHLILDVEGARCTNPRCGFEQTMSRSDYLKRFADRRRMVILPMELGGGLNPLFAGDPAV
jgi:hypothetical protein